jgi:hypothetical protein
MALKLMYITNNSEVAAIAQKYGVDRIWIDLETLGKEERQKGMNTVKSKHCINDIVAIKPILKTSELLVRINPMNQNSKEEIDEVISAGADMIMLPMWKSAEEVQQFLSIVKGRVKTTLLLETKEAVECIDEVLESSGFDEIHIGLNDLHLSYGMTFMFELLTNGTVEMLCNKFKESGIPYGFGGIAKIGEGILPAEKIIMEHYRLGSTRAILSRSFCDSEKIQDIREVDKIFKENMKALRDYEETLKAMDINVFLNNKVRIVESVKNVVCVFGGKNVFQNKKSH